MGDRGRRQKLVYWTWKDGLKVTLQHYRDERRRCISCFSMDNLCGEYMAILVIHINKSSLLFKNNWMNECFLRIRSDSLEWYLMLFYFCSHLFTLPYKTLKPSYWFIHFTVITNAVFTLGKTKSWHFVLLTVNQQGMIKKQETPVNVQYFWFVGSHKRFHVVNCLTHLDIL